MLNIENKIHRLIAAQANLKNNLKLALRSIGVVVDDNLLLKDYPQLIANIIINPSSTDEQIYDKLIGFGFSGVGQDMSTDLSQFNTTWTRITKTDDTILQNNGFKTEKWQIDGGTAILKVIFDLNAPIGMWAVYQNDTSDAHQLISTIDDGYDSPWDIPTEGKWLGEMMIPLTGTCGFKKQSV